MENRDTVPSEFRFEGQLDGDDRVVAVFRCRLALEQLIDTEQQDVKFCDQCQQKAFKITDLQGLEKAVASNVCVWLPTTKTTGHGEGRRNVLIGTVTLRSRDPDRPMNIV